MQAISPSNAETVPTNDFPIRQIYVCLSSYSKFSEESSCLSSLESLSASSAASPSVPHFRVNRCESSFRDAFVTKAPVKDSPPKRRRPSRNKSFDDGSASVTAGSVARATLKHCSTAAAAAAAAAAASSGSTVRSSPSLLVVMPDRWSTGSRERVSPSKLLNKSSMRQDRTI